MSVELVLETLLLEPVLAIFRRLYSFWIDHTPTLGLALVAFALTINLLLAPIYGQMERYEASQSQQRAKMQCEVARMRNHYSGRERYFYVRTVYRHYNYSPALAIVGSGSLMLQIFVFYTAYRFLRDQPHFSGVPFGSIRSLAEPDGLLWGINLLPFLMTAANLAAAFLRSKDRRQRLQAIALAVAFLALLYPSPSALLVYWTTNNFVSLLRSLMRPTWRRVRSMPWANLLTRVATLD